jgi:hypothetical protein
VRGLLFVDHAHLSEATRSELLSVETPDDVAKHLWSFIDGEGRALVQIANWSTPVGSAAAFLLGRGARQKNDESAARELNARTMTQALPKGLSMRWLGTAGFTLAYEDFCLIIDPHLSRHSLRSVLSSHALTPSVETPFTNLFEALRRSLYSDTSG